MPDSITSGINLTIPSRNETNWDASIKANCFVPISAHNHTGSGAGVQLGTNALTADAVTDTKIRLANNAALRARNFANSADLNLIKADASDRAVITPNALMSGTLGVTGLTSLSTLTTSGLATLASASVTATLGVTGTSTLGVVNTGALGATTLASSAAATLASLVVTAGATVGTTLGVTGTATAASATARTHLPTTAQVQDSSLLTGTVGGTADVITLTTAPAVAAYATNQTFRFIATGTNTTTATLNVSGLGAKAIRYADNNTLGLLAGEIATGQVVEVVYDGTQFLYSNSQSSGNLQTWTAAIASTTGGMTMFPFTASVQNYFVRNRTCFINLIFSTTVGTPSTNFEISLPIARSAAFYGTGFAQGSTVPFFIVEGATTTRASCTLWTGVNFAAGANTFRMSFSYPI